MEIGSVIEYLISKIFSFANVLIDAGLVFIFGWIICRFIVHFVVGVMERAKADEIIISFIRQILDIALKIVLLIIVIGALGVNTASLIAVLTTAGAAVVLGLQNSASGIVAGIVILLSKPFSKGDMVEVDGYMGKVVEIQMMYTILLTLDNKRVIIPNSTMAGAVITNYSCEETRRVDLTIDVSYATDIDKAKAVIHKVIEDHPMALDEPEPYIRVSAYKDNSISIEVRVWCQTDDFNDLKIDLLEMIKKEFDRNDITIPYPQLDVHIKEKESDLM